MNVPRGIIHGHLLANFSHLLFFFDLLFFFALFAFGSIGFNLFHNFGNLLARLSFLLFDLVTLVLDTLDLGFALRLLFLILALEESDTLRKMTAHGTVDFFLSRKNNA